MSIFISLLNFFHLTRIHTRFTVQTFEFCQIKFSVILNNMQMVVSPFALIIHIINDSTDTKTKIEGCRYRKKHKNSMYIKLSNRQRWLCTFDDNLNWALCAEYIHRQLSAAIQIFIIKFDTARRKWWWTVQH